MVPIFSESAGISRENTRPWSSRRQRLLLEHGQYGRPGVLNSTPGQSPDRPGLTERVRLKSPEGYGGYRAEIQARAIPLERVCFALMTPGRQSSVERRTAAAFPTGIGAAWPP